MVFSQLQTRETWGTRRENRAGNASAFLRSSETAGVMRVFQRWRENPMKDDVAGLHFSKTTNVGRPPSRWMISFLNPRLQDRGIGLSRLLSSAGASACVAHHKRNHPSHQRSASGLPCGQRIVRLFLASDCPYP